MRRAKSRARGTNDNLVILEGRHGCAIGEIYKSSGACKSSRPADRGGLRDCGASRRTGARAVFTSKLAAPPHDASVSQLRSRMFQRALATAHDGASVSTATY